MCVPYVFHGAGFTLRHVGRGRYAVYLAGQSFGFLFQGSFPAARRYGAYLATTGGV